LIKKGEDYLPMAAYSSIFVETADGSFVFGEKSDKYAANRQYSYIGGSFNRSKKDSDSIDLFEASLAEVREELGIEKKDIEQFRLLEALRSESCNVAFVFYCKLKLSKEKIMGKFKKRNELELKSLFFGKKEDIREIGVDKIGKEPELIDVFEQNIRV